MEIKVKLMASTPRPTWMMGMAARLCYNKMSIDDLEKKFSDEDAEKLVKKILGNRHNGVLEHAVFTFGVEGVSRNFTHQMVRHRNTSYDQQSLHYIVAPDNMEVAYPPRLSPERKWEWDDVKKRCLDLYHKTMADGIPREEARHIIPSGVETKIIMTANLRQWMMFIKIRACPVNCHEITVVAMKIKKMLEAQMPYLKEYLGPPCLTDGICPEGERYCGSPWKTPCTIVGFKDGRTEQAQVAEVPF